MAHSLTYPNFNYASLPLPSLDSIRVLRFKYNASTREATEKRTEGTAKEMTKAKFDIVAFDLDDAPPFHAVFYVWGSDIRDRPLTLASRQNLWITENLETALESVVKHCSTGYLWIDQLCMYPTCWFCMIAYIAGIDQDSLSEKNVQVPLMGRIYSLAYETLIFLAPLDSPLLGELIRSHRTHRARLDVYRMASHGMCPTWTPDIYLGHYQAVVVLMENTWFKRAWVVQEFVLSQRQKFLIAEEVVEFESLIKFSHDFKIAVSTAHKLGRLEPNSRDNLAGSLLFSSGMGRLKFMRMNRNGVRLGDLNLLPGPDRTPMPCFGSKRLGLRFSRAPKRFQDSGGICHDGQTNVHCHCYGYRYTIPQSWSAWLHGEILC